MRNLIPFRRTKLRAGGNSTGTVDTFTFVTSASDSSHGWYIVPWKKGYIPPGMFSSFFFLHSSIVSKCLFHWCTSFLTTWNTFWISVHVLVSFHSQPRITREAVLMRSPQDQTGLGACLWEIILSAGQSLSPLWTARSRVPVCVVYALSTDSLAYTIRHNFSLKLKINIGKKLVSRDTTRNNFVKCVVYCQ